MIRLACQEQLIPGDTLIQKWEFVSAAGFDGIELLGRGDLQFRERLPELKNAREAGVPISSVCVAMDHFIGDFDPERRRDAVDNMASLLSVIAEVGGAGAITPAAFGLYSRALPPWDPPPRSPEEDREVLLEGLRELGEHAVREGTVLFLEPLNRYEDHMVNRLGQAAKLCREAGLGSVKVMADTFHMNIEEDDPSDSIRATGSLIGHVQLGDSARFQPGTGHVDFAAEVAALKEVGFDGWMAMECAIRGDPREALPAVAQLLRPMVDRL